MSITTIILAINALAQMLTAVVGIVRLLRRK